MAETRVTAEKIAQRASLYLSRKLDVTELEEITGQEYRNLTSNYQLSHLHVEGAFVTEAPKSNGTVSVINGSATVTGAGTSFAATDVGRRFRLETFSPSYDVLSVNVGAQTLGIDPPWVATTASAQPYFLYKNLYSVPDASVQWLFSLSGKWPIRETPLTVLNSSDPTRAGTIDTPMRYAYHSRDSSGRLVVELYPIPSEADVIRYFGIKQDLAFTPDQFLVGFESWILFQVVATGCLVVMSKGMPGPWTDLAQAWSAKADAALDRLLSLDLGRTPGIAQVQRTRDDDDWPFSDTDFAVRHDLGW